MLKQRYFSALALVAASGMAATAYAQVANPEIEPNETKAQATAAASGGLGMVATDYITGNSTGTSTTVAGAASADTFLVKTAAAPLGIYRYRLTLGATGHTATIRALGQTAATAGTWPGPVGTANTTDSTAQTSTGGMVQWYGFGKQEQLYYRVTGTATSTSDYTATLDRTAITPVDLGSFVTGAISIDFSNQGHTTDTDMWVYDNNLSPIPGWGDDDRSLNSGSTYTTTSLQSFLKRSYAVGTYYMHVSNYQTQNNLGSPCDDNFRTGLMMDFADVVTNNSTSTGLALNFAVTDSAGVHPFTSTKAAAFDVNWFTFTVIPDTVTGGCCKSDGSCEVLTASGCLAAGGTWRGANSDCTAACPQPGACCLDTGACVPNILLTACTAQGGVFGGEGSVCGTCPATAYVETGDAGDLPGTAQVPTGSGSLLKIRGSFLASDVDMYKINICDAANWSATTVNGTTVDTQLWLFKADGTGVACDDDSTGLQSTLSNLRVAPLGNGTYFLGVSVWNRDPLGATTSGLIWTTNTQDAIPDGPAATEPVGSWTGTTSTTGNYTIFLTGTCFNAAACYANCDNSTVPPILNANDFQCFLNQFAASDPYANCDGSTVPPTLNANDFQCFLNAFAAGCS